MTDRVQPGAIDSVVRNDELAQIFGQFSDGWVVPGDQPTPAAQRRNEIDETALGAFDLTSSSASSLDITLAAGEAFVGGWCVRDQTTSLTLPTNADVTVVVGWTPDVIYDPEIHANRDQADATLVDLERNVSPQYPATPIWDVSTDGSGVVASTDRRQVGPAVDADAVAASDRLVSPVYQTLSDVGDVPEGTIVYVADEQQLFVEDGT